MLITRNMVRVACDDAGWLWAQGDEVLYEMCRRDPCHSDVQPVVAKMWLIGRSYAAAIERKRPKDGSTAEDFYSRIARRLIDSDLDDQISGLNRMTKLEPDSVDGLLDVHAAVIGLLKPDTGDAKRSFASKYLHFHCPTVVPIYDSLAEAAIYAALGRERVRTRVSSPDHDGAYRTFVARVLHLRSELEDEYGISLSPRQMDRLLLSFTPPSAP